jgi:hypothetical protein
MVLRMLAIFVSLVPYLHSTVRECWKNGMSLLVVSIRNIWPNLSYILIGIAAHLVSDATALGADVVAVSDLAHVSAAEFTPQEGDYFAWLPRMDVGRDKLPVDSLKRITALKHDAGRAPACCMLQW